MLRPAEPSKSLRAIALAVAAVAALAPGCATNAAQQQAQRAACERLVTAVKTALDTGSAPVDPDTAAFARTRGLQDSVVPGPGGDDYRFVPRSLPFRLMVAADPRDGGPQYRAVAASLTPEYRRQLVEEGRRCEW